MLAVRLAVRINPGNIIQHLSCRKSSYKYQYLKMLIVFEINCTVFNNTVCLEQLLTDLI